MKILDTPFFTGSKDPSSELLSSEEDVYSPVGFRINGFKTGWFISLLASFFLLALAALPPFVSEGAGSILMELFAGVCHQLPSRSPHIDEVAFAVCHRCFGAYAGFPVAVLLFGTFKGSWPFTSRTAPFFLLIAVLPASIDWLVGILGIWENTPTSRILTGGIMGCAGGYFLTAALVDSFVARKKSRQLREMKS